MKRFSFKSGCAMWVAKLIKQDWPYSVTVRISATFKKYYWSINV